MLKFWADTRGQFAVIFALVAPILLASIALAVDYTSWSGQQRKLQGVADIAALTAAKELYLANASNSQITSVANSVAQAQFTVGGDSPRAPVSVVATVQDNGDAVEVVVTQDRDAYFSQAIAHNFAPLTARAVAKAMGGGRVCVIVLDEANAEVLDMMNSARITAAECGVFSNSKAAAGIRVGGSANILAELTCTSGGYRGNSSNFEPLPLTDCPQISDPLVSRAEPTFSGCDYTDLEIARKTVYLSPGVYCGGLALVSRATANFSPGVYIMKDGPLMVGSRASAIGENVGFFFEGELATFTFVSSASVDLTAPVDGALAGILFFEARASLPGREFSILSDDAHMLLGTIYLPQGTLKVSTNTPVADQSAYTAIVARRMQLQQAPNLVLNSNYSQTDIPVPSALKGAGGKNIVLQR